MNFYYPKSNKDRKLRNKIELITITFYIIGLLLFCVTKNPIFTMVTILSVPFCYWKPIQKFLNDEK